jgi:GAF domain-containing protein
MPHASSGVLETLLAFARTLTGEHEASDVLNDLSARTTTALGIWGAGVSLVKDGRLHFVTSDNHLVADLEQVQERDQQGPCVDAVRSGEPVRVSRLADYRAQWPDYVAQAAALGIRAVATVPMHDGVVLGTVDLYDHTEREWSGDDMTVAALLAHMATGYLHTATAIERERRTTEQLQQALDSRVIIEQAKGVIAATRNIGVDQAFQLLRVHANNRRASLRSVADAVVNLGLRV